MTLVRTQKNHLDVLQLKVERDAVTKIEQKEIESAKDLADLMATTPPLFGFSASSKTSLQIHSLNGCGQNRLYSGW